MGYGGVKMRGGENNGWEEEQRLKNEEKGRTSKETATDRDATEEAPKEAKGGGEGTKKTAARRLEGEGGRRRTHSGNQERRPDDCQLGEWHIQERPEAQLQDLERPEEVVAVDFAKHTVREHIKVADTWANREDRKLDDQEELGGEQHQNDQEYLDGSAEDGSGCGIVIKAVDRQSCSLFLQDCTAVEQMHCDAGRDVN